MEDIQEQTQEIPVSGGEEGGEDSSIVEEFKGFLEDDEKMQEEPSGEETQETAELEEKPEEVSKEPAPEKEDGLAAPAWWTEAEKEAWGKTPPEVQKAVASRIQQVEAFAAQTSQKQQLGDALSPIGHALARHADYLKEARINGQTLAGNPALIAQEVDSLFRFKELAFEDPQAFIREVGQLFAGNGVDLAQLVHAMGTENQRWNDPETLRSQRELAELKAWKEQQERSQAESRREQYMQTVARGIIGMSDAKGDDGTQMFPHLHGEHAQNIGTMMGRFLRANAAGGTITNELFQQAYDAAVYAYKPTREAEIKAVEARRAHEAEAAKKRMGIVPRNANAGGMEPETLEQALNSKYNELMGG